MTTIGSTLGSSSHREARYTQGFVFENGRDEGGYARAVVERSCAAVLTLFQDVVAVAEKTAFQQAMEQVSIRAQNRAFRRVADIVRSRPLLEKSVVTAVTCAYAEMVTTESAKIENARQIEKYISELESLRCEQLDLVALLGVDAVTDHATNRNRPLLFDLNAQLGLLFGHETKHMACSPLSPATLIGGFVAGLMCAEMDIVAKQWLFRVFEQEFLSKLSALMNSIILRLEQENISVQRAVGFDDKNAGPIERVLANPLVVPMSVLHAEVNKMHSALSAHQGFGVASQLYDLSGEDTMESMVQLLADIRYEYEEMQSVVFRSLVKSDETHELIAARKIIAQQLNETFSGKRMPAVVKVFLETLWPDVLFDLYAASGDSSEAWQNALSLQQSLLDSITPVTSAERSAALNQIIPGIARSLRRLLDETGCRFEDITAFLGELKLLHLQNMQQKLHADNFVLWEAVSLDHFSPSPVSIMKEDEIFCYQQLQKIISLSTHV